MNVILCVDDNGGLMFNNRRQSRDRLLIKKICEICGSHPLWINSYSSSLFADTTALKPIVDPDFLAHAKSGDYVFVENCSLANYEDRIEAIFLFKWNRVYPCDFSFDIPLSDHGWHCASTEDFAGSSHDKITLEVYIR